MKTLKKIFLVIVTVIGAIFLLKFFKKTPQPKETEVIENKLKQIENETDIKIQEAKEDVSEIPITNEEQVIGLTKTEIEEKSKEDVNFQENTTEKLEEIKDKYRI